MEWKRRYCAYLQSGQYDLLHRVEVSLPQELGLLSEGKDLVLVDGSHCWRDLKTEGRTCEHACITSDRFNYSCLQSKAKRVPSREECRVCNVHVRRSFAVVSAMLPQHIHIWNCGKNCILVREAFRLRSQPQCSSRWFPRRGAPSRYSASPARKPPARQSHARK